MVENQMSEANSSTCSASADENPQENEQNETVLKDSNKKLCKKRARQVPAKANDTRHFGPPFSKVVYNLFISAIKYGEIAYPTTRELRKVDFFTTKGTRHRKRFRELLRRFELHVVQGPLVFSPNLEEDVLVLKRSGKIILPREDVANVIRRAHLWGCNEANEATLDERKCKHYNVGQTLTVLSKVFTVSRREFGISREIVQSTLARCTSCNKCSLTPDDELKLKQLNDTDKNIPYADVAFPSEAKMGSLSEQPSAGLHDKNNLEKARFPSMVAHVPDKTCIWYDRKSIAETTNGFEKLMMVVGEMRGEMGLAVKGNVEAKQRLEAKLYCGQLLIKDQAKAIQRLLIQEDSPKVFRTELGKLESEYKETGQTNMFNSDITSLLAHVKAHKLLISPLIIREIEDFVKKGNYKAHCTGEIAR